jgi:predicted amidohydrolase YtcJ
MKTKILSLLTILLFVSCGLKFQKADTVYHNLQYYNVHSGQTLAGAIAITDGKITAIGPEREVMNSYRAEKSIDLQGGICYPGLIDAHSHFLGYAKSFLKVNLAGCTSKKECLERIKAFASANPDAKWITGRGWDHSLWDNNFPDKKDLDDLGINKPIYLKRIDGHSAWLNSRAMALAKLEENVNKTGYVAIQRSGKYIGIVQENFLDFIDKLVPPYAKAEVKTALTRAEAKIFASGLTAVTDAGLSKEDILLLNEAYDEGVISIPLYLMANPDEETLNWLETKPELNKKISCYSVKMYADGSLGSRSACLKQPYHDDLENHGVLTTDFDDMQSIAKRCTSNNWQLNTHCIGDSAGKVVLNLYGKTLGGSNDKRWRIEHAQVVDPLDLDLYSQHNIIPSIQPTHATSDMRWAEDRLSNSRIQNAYNYKALLACNGIIALGTDFPVEDISPLKTYYSSVFRQQPFTQTPEQGFLKESALSSSETIKGMTLYAAIANKWENKYGSLDTGKVANITVLSQKLNSSKWANPVVRQSILAGEIVFEN